MAKAIETLLSKRIVVVTGKGGTGKTTVAVTLGMEAARRGLRVVIAEVAGSQQVPRLFGVPGTGYKTQTLQPRLDTFSITPEESLEDYVVMQVRLKSIYRLVFRNRIIAPFMDAVPGLPDLMTLGKLYHLEQQLGEDGRPIYDLIVLDAPSTGHAITLLRSPQAMMEMTAAGPFHDNAKNVHGLFSDRQKVGLVLTAVPETLPINETIDLYQALGQSQSLVECVVLNKTWRCPVEPPRNWEEILGALRHGDADWDAAVDLAATWISRAEQTSAAAERLAAALPCPMFTLPLIVTRDLSLQHVSRLQQVFREAVQ
jgi:anion-transporting  ArsA/GET3 family ATPase